jgi:hypothetical protein
MYICNNWYVLYVSVDSQIKRTILILNILTTAYILEILLCPSLVRVKHELCLISCRPSQHLYKSYTGRYPHYRYAVVTEPSGNKIKNVDITVVFKSAGNSIIIHVP